MLPKQLEIMFSVEEIKAKLQKRTIVLLSTLDSRDNILKIQRRYRIRAIQGTGYHSSFPLLVKELKKRDEQDMNRPVEPLRQAEDAVLVDTTNLSFDEAVDAILAIVEERRHA